MNRLRQEVAGWGRGGGAPTRDDQRRILRVQHLDHELQEDLCAETRERTAGETARQGCGDWRGGGMRGEGRASHLCVAADAPERCGHVRTDRHEILHV